MWSPLQLGVVCSAMGFVAVLADMLVQLVEDKMMAKILEKSSSPRPEFRTSLKGSRVILLPCNVRKLESLYEPRKELRPTKQP